MQQRGQRATASAAWPNKPRKNWTLFSCHQEFYPFFFTSGLSKCIRKLTENSVASLVTLRQAHPVHDFDFYAFYTHYRGRGSFQLRTGVMISFAPWLLLPFHRCRCCCPIFFWVLCVLTSYPTYTLTHTHTQKILLYRVMHLPYYCCLHWPNLGTVLSFLAEVSYVYWILYRNIQLNKAFLTIFYSSLVFFRFGICKQKKRVVQRRKNNEYEGKCTHSYLHF